MAREAQYRVIYHYRGQYAVKAMCVFFKISRAAYYAWVKKIEQTDRDAERLALVKEAWEKSKRAYGYRRIAIWLDQQKGLCINHKAVLRLMHKLNIRSVARKPKSSKPNPGQADEIYHRYENILNRNFLASKPNQKWATDISFIHTSDGWGYLSVIKDLYDGFIVAYQFQKRNTISLVTDTLKLALSKEKVTDRLILHSDQGHQYTSHAYFVLTKKYNITPSMSRKGNCLDNASIESFFGHFKEESLRQYHQPSFEQAAEIINQYICFYNYERIQLKTRQTPYHLRCLSS